VSKLFYSFRGEKNEKHRHRPSENPEKLRGSRSREDFGKCHPWGQRKKGRGGREEQIFEPSAAEKSVLVLFVTGK